MWRIFIPLLTLLSILVPAPVLAQSTDPFALTPEKTQLFEGYQASSSATGSLFNGDGMKDNGLFTTPNTQLGGAAPPAVKSSITPTPTPGPTAPGQTNVDTAQFIILTSSYEPGGDLTKDSRIRVRVKARNVSSGDINRITMTATLRDTNATLLDDPAPNPPVEAGSDLADPKKGMIWKKMKGNKVFSLKSGEETEFGFSVQSKSDDDILRFTFTATFGAGESILYQWIPIKNPNPVGNVGGGTTSPGGGGANPCAGGVSGSGAFPDSLPQDQIVAKFLTNWNLSLDDQAYSYKDPQFKGLLKAWWEVLTSVECTPYITDALGGNTLHVIGAGNGGGWWGEYMGGYIQNMWIDAISAGSVPHIKQNLIHELGHVWRGTQFDGKYADYEATVCGKGSPNVYVSVYGGTNCSENMSEIAGYYSVRESDEWGVGGAFCQGKNPFDWGQATYYNWAKTTLYGGKEFGPSAPTSGSC